MQTVVDAFKFHAGRSHTGLIQISKGHYTGGIFLRHGLVVHAELYDKSGLDALFELLEWDEAANIWLEGQTPECSTTNFPMDYVLECYEREKKQRTQEFPGITNDSLLKSTGQTHTTTEEGKTGLMDLDKLMVVLESRSPEWRTQEYALADFEKKSYLIGSALDCDIQLNHKSVADQHCAILLDEGVLRLWDLGTGGATLVNDQVVEDMVLAAGDRLQIGSLSFAVNLKLRRSTSSTNAPTALIPNLKSPATTAQSSGAKNALNLSGPISFSKIQDKQRAKQAPERKSVLAGLFNKNKKTAGSPSKKTKK